EFVEHYNTKRLHSAIGYITPADKLAGREAQIFAQRDRKLEAARQARQTKRAALLTLAAPAAKQLIEPADRPNANTLDNGAGRSILDLSSETEAGSAEVQPAKG